MRRKRGESEEAGVCRRTMLRAVCGRTAGSRNGGLCSRQPTKKRAGPGEEGSSGTRSRPRGPGPPAVVDVPLAGVSSGPSAASLYTSRGSPGKHLDAAGPHPPPASREPWEEHPKSCGAMSAEAGLDGGPEPGPLAHGPEEPSSLLQSSQEQKRILCLGQRLPVLWPFFSLTPAPAHPPGPSQ